MDVFDTPPAQSYFYRTRGGTPKKAKACPPKIVEVDSSTLICGKPPPEGKFQFSPDETIRSCAREIGISPSHPILIEKKFDGFRGIYEGLSGSTSGTIFTKDQGPQTKFFPREAASLLNKHLRSRGVDDIILDGEMFLSDCFVNGGARVPIIGDQQKGIRGEWDHLVRNCRFTYQVFDILRYKKKIVTDLPLRDRKRLLEMILPDPIEGSATTRGISPRFTQNIAIVPVQGKVASGVDEAIDEYCQVVADGHEGLVLKDLASRYAWENLSRPDRKGWWKVKAERDVDTEVVRACLGDETYSNTKGNNTFRYRKLDLGICTDPECSKLEYVGRTGSPIKGSDIRGIAGWDARIHKFVLDLLKAGEATPTKKWRLLDEVVQRAGVRTIPTKMFDDLIGDTTKDGRRGLPNCINLPLHRLIVTVFTNEVQLNEDDSITLRGPPRIGRIRDDKDRPNDRDYVLSLRGSA